MVVVLVVAAAAAAVNRIEYDKAIHIYNEFDPTFT